MRRSSPQAARRHADPARRRRRRADAVSLAGGDRRRRGLREDRARDRAARCRRRGGVPVGSRPRRVGTRSRHPRQLRSARLYFVLHRRRRRMPRVVDSAPHPGAAGGGRNSQRHRPRVHPRRGRRLRRADRARDRWPRAAITAKCGSRARSMSSRTATSSISVSRHDVMPRRNLGHRAGVQRRRCRSAARRRSATRRALARDSGGRRWIVGRHGRAGGGRRARA